MIQKLVLPSQFLKFLYSIALETNSAMFTIAISTLNMINWPLFRAYGTDNCRGISFDEHASQNVFGFLGCNINVEMISFDINKTYIGVIISSIQIFFKTILPWAEPTIYQLILRGFEVALRVSSVVLLGHRM